jgi:hypothetical protein
MNKRLPLTLSLAMLLPLSAACEVAIDNPSPGSTLPGSTDDPTDTTDGMDNLPPAVGPMKQLTFTESSADILNPERGFYVGYKLLSGGDANAVREGGHTLAISVTNLQDYRDRPLDETVLNTLRSSLAKVRAAGIKIVLRFTYNSDYAPDAPKDIILGHLEQLAPIMQENSDVIAVVQAGLIGAWGEWHSSTNNLDNPEDQADIIDGLLTAVPTNRAVAIRTPMDLDAYMPGGPLTASKAYDGSPRSRLTHHNDCFLASATDYGTYASPIEDWENYVAADGEFNATGGETCAVYEPKTACDASIATMAKLHWSYLNLQYRQEVIAGWQTNGCFQEIEQRLGYRFALDTVEHNDNVAPGATLAVDLTLHNSGFASPYNERPVELVISNGSVRKVIRVDGVDARSWKSGTSTTINARVQVPADLEPGTYTLSVRLPDASSTIADDSRYAIQLANEGVWDETTGDNVLTRSLVIGS